MKLPIVSISSRSEGTRSTSTSEKTRSISSATARLKRSAWTKSTAEMNRDWRKVFGQASGVCIFRESIWRLSVSSSKAAADSANRIAFRQS